jgi:NADH:ubiquinone oxidoreductase subunit 5 (subunit L)/multisubunit Na+/H+ antiporter MnhA subunit
VAYSTASQLGFMFLSIGLSMYDVALFHLFNHAFFKAALFLTAGSYIHRNGGQRLTLVAGRSNFLTSTTLLIASCALTAFPLFSGFFSKDLIIESVISRFWVGGQFLATLAVLSAACTFSYASTLDGDDNGVPLHKNI